MDQRLLINGTCMNLNLMIIGYWIKKMYSFLAPLEERDIYIYM